MSNILTSDSKLEYSEILHSEPEQSKALESNFVNN